MTTATTDCQHERAISYTEDDQRYHGCRDCGAIIPIEATEQQPTPRLERSRQALLQADDLLADLYQVLEHQSSDCDDYLMRIVSARSEIDAALKLAEA